MSEITWFHLSDLHFRVGEGHSWDRDIVLRKLLEDVRGCMDSEGLRPDLILVSGDIAFSGRIEEYDLARRFFDELLDAAGLSRERLLIVPGNHDVDRKAISRGAHAIAASLDNRQAVNEVLGNEQDRRMILRRFDAYARFVGDYFAGQIGLDDKHYFYTRTFELAGRRIVVLGLNSAVLAAGDEDRGRLVLGERQVRETLEASRGADLRIALMHHPFDWLREFDRDDCESPLMGGCDFILHGHLHRTGLQSLTTPDARAMIIAAGACYETRDYPNACNWLQLDVKAGQGTVYLRTYSDQSGGFWTKDVMTYQKVSDGRCTFTLSSPAAAKKRGEGIRPAAAGMSAQETARWRDQYLKKMGNACNALPLATFGGEECADQDVTLDQVYIDLNTTTPVALTDKEKKERKANWAMRDRDEDTRLLMAREAAVQSSRLVLLGDPGAGKSTFALRLLGRCASAQAEGGPPPKGIPGDLLPIRIILPDLAPRLAALEMETLSADRRREALAFAMRDEILDNLDRLEAEGFAQGMLESLGSGRCLLVLDGLDEVLHDQRLLVREAAAAVIGQYRVQRVIVTCRVRSYVGEAVLPGFDAHTLAPFDADQVRGFAKAWYKAQKDLGRVDAKQAASRADDLSEAALSQDLRELSSNPMMLTTMAIIHHQDVGLPKERVRLYNRAVDVLLLRWQKRKTGEGALTPSEGLRKFLKDDLRLRQVMERLAYEAHRAGQGRRETADLPRGGALTLLESPRYLGDLWLSKEFLDYAEQRAGLLVGRGGGPGRPATYGFPHRTFQEYLAGCYMAGQRDAAREYFSRAGEGDYWSLAALLGAEELQYNRRNIHGLLDLAYRLCPATAPGDEKTRRALLWSGQMADLAGRDVIKRDMESPDGGKSYLDRLIPRLVDLLPSELTPLERVEAGRTLSGLGDPRFCADAWSLPDEPLLGFVDIPAGPFKMGSDEKRDKDSNTDERPEHPVTLPAFYMARYPVTVAQFKAFANEEGYSPDDPDCLKGPDNHPVIWVTWHEALKYCDWLNKTLREWGHTPEPMASLLKKGDGTGGRWRITLPSEAEWEKGARGGDGRIYPWGDEEPDPDRANYSDTRIGGTSAVGCFPRGASPYGCLDMAGNVWEWTRSLWGEKYDKPHFKYPYVPGVERERLDAGDKILRVLRGGAFNYNAGAVRCASRDGDYPGLRSDCVGFRVVLAPEKPSVL
ncbi:MAG: SUMF1/EgtB/PvdO family nonheme iron enzyme [Deltaproteobacteria bacterium]|nr:SUMF1/EgtB/PvdO family nonheme iron enzyme [Deltaproteobacteria bacterium]